MTHVLYTCVAPHIHLLLDSCDESRCFSQVNANHPRRLYNITVAGISNRRLCLDSRATLDNRKRFQLRDANGISR